MTLQLAYMGLTLLMNIILIMFGFKAIKSFDNSSKEKNKKTILIISLLVWQVYVFLISKSGILNNFDFPPRFFLFLVLPLFVFTAIFIYKNRKNNWIDHIPAKWLFYYQSFRILIESIFVASVAQGILHELVTIKGYNFDMIYAFTIPVIGFVIFQKKVASIKLAIFWNYLGLAIIVSIIFLFLTSVFAPQMYGSDTNMLPVAAVSYPYTLVAGFLMPSAVFVHILSIVQLNRMKRTS